jgi:hypothetical protein
MELFLRVILRSINQQFLGKATHDSVLEQLHWFYSVCHCLGAVLVVRWGYIDFQETGTIVACYILAVKCVPSTYISKHFIKFRNPDTTKNICPTRIV